MNLTILYLGRVKHWGLWALFSHLSRCFFYLQCFYVTPNFEQPSYGLDKTLVVVVTHAFNLLVMTLDTVVQFVHKKLCRFVAIINSPAEKYLVVSITTLNRKLSLLTCPKDHKVSAVFIQYSWWRPGAHWGHWWRRLHPTSSIITDAKSLDSNLDYFAR